MLNLYFTFTYTVLGTLFAVHVHNTSHDKCKIQKQAVNSEKTNQHFVIVTILLQI